MTEKPKARGVVREDGKRYASVAQAAADSNCHQSAIYAACSGRRQQAGGYSWRYADTAPQPVPSPTGPVDESDPGAPDEAG